MLWLFQDECYLLDICKFIQVCCRVRGFKQVAKHLPHEVYQLEPCCELLSRQNRDNFDQWETRYVLLLWMSSLVLIPFDLSSMDSKQDGGGPDLVQKLISSAMVYIGDPGPTREAAGFCLANLLTRPDMEAQNLKSFLDNAATVLEKRRDSQENKDGRLSSDYFEYIGILSCLNQIFKRGHRGKLYPLAHQIYTPSNELAAQSVQTVERKLLCKLIQRLGMTFLPPREASWRYQRGQRSLYSALQSKTKSSSSTGSALAARVHGAEHKEEEEEEIEYPPELEDIIGTIISFLSDKDTVVRWSAAKGIGRITMRLSQGLASDVVDALFALFEDDSSDMNWHGGCLAIAELVRRGLLLPDKLSLATKIINQGMHFDLLRGQHSVGAHVRDAASYVCWAFARAYSPKDLAAYRDELFHNMLLSSLFDREVNCRRAASAALQEFIGRQGHEYFTESLSIISIADFFAVGNRSTAFLDLSATIACLHQKYLTLCLDHLIDEKVNHWDEEIRVITSKAIARLLMVDATSAGERLRKLLPYCSSARLADRHGGLLAVANILFCLSKTQALDEDIVQQIEALLVGAEKARLFRGKGGELVREALCQVIDSLARSRLKISQKTQVALVELLMDQLKQPHEMVQRAAQSAWRLALFNFFGDALPLKPPTDKLQALSIHKILAALKQEGNVAVTRGFCLALGALPERLATLPLEDNRIDTVLDVLEDYASAEKRIMGDHDAETSRNAVEAVIELAERLCESPRFTTAHFLRCFTILERAGRDYSVDKRGDTGSWSRILALKGMERLIYAASPRISGRGQAWRHRNEWTAQTTRWMTAYGLGEVQTISQGRVGPIATIRYSAQSLGSAQSTAESWASSDFQPTQCLIVPVHPASLTYSGDGEEQAPMPSAEEVEAWAALQLSELLSRALTVVLKQMAEKLDAVREVAGTVFWRLLTFHEGLKRSAENALDAALQVMREIVCVSAPNGQPNQIQWGQAGQVYPILAQLLAASPLFFHSIFSGLIISVGGVSKSIAKAAADGLLQACALQSQNPAFIKSMAGSLVELLTSHKKVDRVILPLLKTMEILLKNNKLVALPVEEAQKWRDEVFQLLQEEMKRCTSIPKIRIVVEVLVLLATMELGEQAWESARRILFVVLKMLAHRYPKTRKRKLPCGCRNYHLSLRG